MLNKEEKSKWMDERMAKGWSFKYNKGIVNGERMNVSVTCIEDNQTFVFDWEKTITMKNNEHTEEPSANSAIAKILKPYQGTRLTHGDIGRLVRKLEQPCLQSNNTTKLEIAFLKKIIPLPEEEALRLIDERISQLST